MRRRKRQRDRPLEVFRRAVRSWAVRLQVEPTGIYVQGMTTKWGSCSSKGRLCFAKDLLSKPSDFRTAVIVHELLHLAVRNHGRLFSSLMSAYVPDWRRTSLTNVRGICGRRQTIEADAGTRVLRLPSASRAA
jgi:predicted metal-dependent hydrolase